MKSITVKELDQNRAILINALLRKDKDYIRKTWYPKEERVIYCYTEFYLRKELRRRNNDLRSAEESGYLPLMKRKRQGLS